ncbi:N4-gp56 family major capsid protein [Phreatobacter oligotrophus]|uniref:N4-gp56 family major capsid protein n=1 Tax=Phreatobacter oligotrophus TaxID=1122261 RepID=A0A2T4ZIT4_9HYPH|nr:N4-gp56 family major capsid protein [Phreatobacter oligotrophus]PTM61896.1 N4-gp56 family major capsid protein [Phreatobacter oligotrophus]
MAGPTNIPVGDPKAAKRWSGTLFLEVLRKAYFERKFIGESQNSLVQKLTDLESAAGDTISFDVSVQLRGTPTYGDDRVEGKAENLRFFTDTISIDQMRKTVSSGGRMTRKRTTHNLRSIAKDRLSDYWAKYHDEAMFIYLSGARGINEDYFEPASWVGYANNPIQAPDSAHLMYGGTATAKANVTTASTMSRVVIERAAVKAQMMRAVDPTKANMMPVMINGESHYVCLMSPFQEHDLRQESGVTGWLEVQKAAAQAEGRNNPIFKGGLGMIKNVVLHAHESVIRFNDYGSGANLAAARALFLGRQAGVIAYGSNNGMRSFWNEEPKDHGNEMEVMAGFIVGQKKTRFNGADFGVLSIDTYAANPG